MICPDCCTDCEYTLVDFDDGTADGTGLTHDPVEPPWFIVDEGLGKRLRYASNSPGTFLWTVPTQNTGEPASFFIRASVLGDLESAPAGQGGGVTMIGDDWSASWGIENSVAVLRVNHDGGYELEETFGEEFLTSTSFALHVTSPCHGRTGVQAWIGDDIVFSFAAPFSLEPYGLPANVVMGVYVPTDTEAADADLPFPECCPADTSCYSGYTATGDFENEINCSGCTTSAQSASLSTTALSCGGTPLSSLLTGFDPADGYLIADLPVNTFDSQWTGWKVLAWCDGSTFRAAVIDASNCVQWAEVAAFSTTCDPLSVKFYFPDPIFDCCEDTIGDFGITFAGTPMTCADPDPREFDDVVMRACGGAEPPECPGLPPGDPVTLHPSCGSLTFSIPSQFTIDVPAGNPGDCCDGYYGPIVVYFRQSYSSLVNDHRLCHFVWNCELTDATVQEFNADPVCGAVNTFQPFWLGLTYDTETGEWTGGISIYMRNGFTNGELSYLLTTAIAGTTVAGPLTFTKEVGNEWLCFDPGSTPATLDAT